MEMFGIQTVYKSTSFAENVLPQNDPIILTFNVHGKQLRHRRMVRDFQDVEIGIESESPKIELSNRSKSALSTGRNYHRSKTIANTELNHTGNATRM